MNAHSFLVLKLMELKEEVVKVTKTINEEIKQEVLTEDISLPHAMYEIVDNMMFSKEIVELIEELILYTIETEEQDDDIE